MLKKNLISHGHLWSSIDTVVFSIQIQQNFLNHCMEFEDIGYCYSIFYLIELPPQSLE